MMKMYIELDENKILNEGRYDLNKIKAYLYKAFEKRGMYLDEEGWYVNGNFSTCGSLIVKLSRSAWFMDNVIQWLWYDTSDSSTEDLKKHYYREKVSA